MAENRLIGDAAVFAFRDDAILLESMLSLLLLSFTHARHIADELR